MSDELDEYFAMTHRRPFLAGADPNAVPQEGTIGPGNTQPQAWSYRGLTPIVWVNGFIPPPGIVYGTVTLAVGDAYGAPFVIPAGMFVGDVWVPTTAVDGLAGQACIAVDDGTNDARVIKTFDLISSSGYLIPDPDLDELWLDSGAYWLLVRNSSGSSYAVRTVAPAYAAAGWGTSIGAVGADAFPATGTVSIDITPLTGNWLGLNSSVLVASLAGRCFGYAA